MVISVTFRWGGGGSSLGAFPRDLKTWEVKRQDSGLLRSKQWGDRDWRTTMDTRVAKDTCAVWETQQALAHGYLSPGRLMFPNPLPGPTSAPWCLPGSSLLRPPSELSSWGRNGPGQPASFQRRLTGEGQKSESLLVQADSASSAPPI